MLKILINILFSFFIATCTFQSSFTIANISTPTTQCGMCKETIEERLLSIKGVKSANVNLAKQKTIIKYDSKIVNLKDLEHSISQSGYQANKIKSDPKAYERLPYCCRLP